MNEAGYGALIRRRRLAVPLSQAELAERSGLSVREVADIERGRRRACRPSTTRALADAFGLSDGERARLGRMAHRAWGEARRR